MSWIDCDEELPSIHQDVLVYGSDESLFSVAYISVQGDWCCSMFHEFLDFEPTHWQPLPEPPSDD